MAVFKVSCTYFKGLFNTTAHHKRLLFFVVLLVLLYTSTGNSEKNKNFDYFIFSQRWLPTSCIAYEEHGSSHQCSLPKNYQFWAIHGLWPTQNNHLGPFFCNSSMIFDINSLKPIESDLKLKWPNIEKEKGVASLWEHEWYKHGTCAAQLESLNSEFKYFNFSLSLFKTYNIQDLFNKASIKPSFDNDLRVSEVFLLVEKEFGKQPQINCFYEVNTKKPYLSEIRLCYNKNLQLINCGNIIGNKLEKSLTNCPLEGGVILPDKIHPQIKTAILLDSSTKRTYNIALSNILSTLKFLMWASI